jgi:VWFA-related protein
MFNRQRMLTMGSALAVVLTLLGTPTMAQDSEEQPQVHITQLDTSHFPIVTVYVSATDEYGEPAGIEPDQLIIHEDGQLIQPDQLQGSAEVVDALTTMLVVDISGSMDTADKLDTAKTAARSYVEQMRSGDQTGLLSFNTEVVYAQPITPEVQLLTASIDSLVAINDTAMYDALVEAVDLLAPLAGRKAIIVLTDGMDNRSTSGIEDVIHRIGPSGLTISTVGLGNPEDKLATIAGIDEPALQTLASQAGGEYAYANDSESLTRLYQRYARVLQSEYAITYTSPGTLRDGLTRHLSISLDDGGPAAQVGTYNPGGLVPEVSEPANWTFFLGVLGLLVLMLFLPGIVSRTASFALPRKMAPPKKRKPLIRFTDK